MLLLALAIGCGGGGSAAPAAVRVRVESVAPRPLERNVGGPGVVRAADSVDLVAEASGVVRSVAFEDGAQVTQGQVLVRLADADARAGLLDAEARVTLAAASLARARSLAGERAVAAVELEQAEAQDALARAAVIKAREALRRTKVVAPFAGTVGRRLVAPGGAVESGTVVTRLESVERLSVDLSLAEGSASSLRDGQRARVEVPALGVVLDADVSFVSPRVREDSRTLDVRLTLAVPPPGVRPGMSAVVTIVTDTAADVILVPAEALVGSADAASVWVVSADSTVASRPVVPGERTADRVEIVSGLVAGDVVVVEGIGRLRPGAAVVVTQDPAGGGLGAVSP